MVETMAMIIIALVESDIMMLLQQIVVLILILEYSYLLEHLHLHLINCDLKYRIQNIQVISNAQFLVIAAVVTVD
jgi:hypothetical protein